MNKRWKEIRERHNFQSENRKAFPEIASKCVFKDRGELLKMVEQLQAQLSETRIKHQKDLDFWHKQTELREKGLKKAEAQLEAACDKVLLANEAAQAANNLRLDTEAQLAAVRNEFAGMKFVSADKDNMEFNVTVTCWQKEALQAAIGEKS